MTLRIFSFLVFAGASALVHAADPKYPVTAIPADLKTNVNVVIREDHMVYSILDKNRCSYKVHQVYTILNPKGKDYAVQVIGYDKHSKIKSLSGTVYDKNGKQIKRLKNSEIYDQSAYDGSLFSDNRLKAVDLTQGSYPYTVEFEYEVDFKYLFAIPSFVLVPGEEVAVQRSSYTLRFAPGLEPRYKTHNTNTEPTRSIAADGLHTISWSFENVKPIKFEPFSDPLEVLTRISAAPTTFQFDAYAGDMSSWQNFGKWIAQLNASRRDLPESTRQKVLELTEGLSSTAEKVKVLYEFLQSKTRYVSIQLGIGGYQPFPASVVDQNGYGDCKALSNYMVAMLETAGINAHYTLIDAGTRARPLDETFPATQFNHVVVMVPLENDTIWLECTSQTNPFGYQGTFTGDRKALIITNDGAEVVRTTSYSAEDNMRTRTGDVFVDINGNAKTSVKTLFKGLRYEQGNLHFILNGNFDEQKKWVQSNTGIPSFDIVNFSMKNHKDRIPVAEVDLELQLRNYASANGKRIFLTPNLMSRMTYIPEKVDVRKTNVVRKYPQTDVDTIRFHLPEEIYPEFLPEPVRISSRFGEYEAAFEVNQGSLVYTRRMTVNKGVFPPETYTEMIDFYKSVNKADNVKLVFLNKT